MYFLFHFIPREPCKSYRVGPWMKCGFCSHSGSEYASRCFRKHACFQLLSSDRMAFLPFQKLSTETSPPESLSGDFTPCWRQKWGANTKKNKVALDKLREKVSKNTAGINPGENFKTVRMVWMKGNKGRKDSGGERSHTRGQPQIGDATYLRDIKEKKPRNASETQR